MVIFLRMEKVLHLYLSRGHSMFGRPGLSPIGPLSEFKKFRDMAILWIIEQNSPSGITGYQLQNDFDIPQTNAYRLLNKLNEEGFVDVHESIVDGRAQKRYGITKKGHDRIKTLMSEAAEKILFLFEITAAAFPLKQFEKFILGNIHIDILKKKLEDCSDREVAMNVLTTAKEFLGHIAAIFTTMLDKTHELEIMLEQVTDSARTMEPFSAVALLKIMDRVMKERTHETSEVTENE
ncbi:hypothetical protein GF325_05190 [Candidatus Bathyarchaeota archaeon]|nr:hypothetical protein [Candidatus Bathyarchaeota archaeon]